MSKLVVGLTGGIASGKSQVSSYFQELSVNVIDADVIARNLFSANSPHLLSLRKKFGDSIFHSDDTLNRKALGQIVFSEPEKLDWLNQLTHPLVAQEILQQLAEATSPYVVIDVPLLIKKDGSIVDYLWKIIDRILVVDVSTQTQLDRVTRRDKISEKQAKQIMLAQASSEQRKQHADDIIDNNGNLQSLKEQVLKLHEFYLSESLQ